LIAPPETAIRYQSLDALRGVAVLGILLMNIVAFALPSEAYVNGAIGRQGWADELTWAFMSIFVDGKMRGLFSLLFGASMFLVIGRAEARGGDGAAVHRKRMFWLLVFGLIHGSLIWYGDILAIYALCGFAAMAFVHDAAERQVKIGLGLFATSWLIWAALTLLALGELPASIDREQIAADIAAHRGSWLDAAHWRNAGHGLEIRFYILISALVETIGLFVLGMGLFQAGFFTGGWDAARLKRIAARAYLVGISGGCALAFWGWSADFAPRLYAPAETIFGPAFRLATTIGHAALGLLLIERCARTRLVLLLAAAGRMAFTNYIASSLIMTFVFYGFGLAQFGHWSRAQIYLFVPPVWALILLWSQPWLARFGQGPLEWLWRRLVQGRLGGW
jgi:uncharacterized protein